MGYPEALVVVISNLAFIIFMILTFKLIKRNEKKE